MKSKVKRLFYCHICERSGLTNKFRFDSCLYKSKHSQARQDAPQTICTDCPPEYKLNIPEGFYRGLNSLANELRELRGLTLQEMPRINPDDY